jgi:8-oxo-dGTP pyrophosphatase MutT (NUDIX family)
MSVERRAFSVAIFARHVDSSGSAAVLLIRHKRLGTWLPVGGEIEAGETPLEAAHRELFEETGLRGHFPGVDPLTGSPPGLLGYEEHPAGGKGTHLNFAFVADVPTREVVGCEEFDAHRWVRDTSDVACPQNVRELVERALAAPRSGEPPLAQREAEAHALGERWLDAFNRPDLEALLGLYTEDATHVTPRQPAPLVGKPALRAWWRASFSKLPGLHYRRVAVTASGERLVVEYDRELPGHPTERVCVTMELREHEGKARIAGSRVHHG